MAVVGEDGGVFTVSLGGRELGRFSHLLDAHCFALQLMERGLAQSVRLHSGITVT